MSELTICPLCGKPVNTNQEAHITEPDGTVKHHECPTEQPAEPVQE